jgi:hypothetical protein
MKQLTLFLGLLLLGINSYSQNPIKFRWSSEVNDQAVDTVKNNVNGTSLHKGDNFVMYLSAAGNGNTTTRQLLLDFQYQNTALELVSIANTGTGGNGGILPQNSNAQESYYQYPGYTFTNTTQNSTSNGTTNYQYCQYSYTSGGPNTIVRYNLTWSSTQGMPYGNYWGLLKLTFKVKTTMTGFNMNPVKLNFVAAWTGAGAYDATTQENPLKETIYLNPNADSYVNAKIDINANMTTVSPMKVMFYDTLSKIGYLNDITSDGTVNVNQSQLQANTVYRVMAMVNMDKLTQIQNAAVTVSDFTGPQNEFVKTGLDGTPANINMTTGASYLSADMNNDKVFNGGDLPILLASAVGLDTLLKTPQGYVAGTNGYMSVWTFTDTVFNNITTANWAKTDLMSGVYFKTGRVGDYLPLNLKYLLWGDVNRSHSSQVVNSQGSIVSTALPSLKSSGIAANAVSANMFMNTTKEIQGIDVSLNNLTVTSNNIEIPITVDTKGLNVGALQFQFEYDPTKIKFEELASTLPGTWYMFANSKEGKVKFGAIDNQNKTPLTGSSSPFKLKFSTIGNGVDLLTSIKVSPSMDASDNIGNQLGINLNTTQIKLTGYNNF